MFLRSNTLLPVREEADPGHVPAPHRPEPHRGGHRRDEQEGGRAPAAVLLGRSRHDQTAAQAPGQRERPGEPDAGPGNPHAGPGNPQGSSCGPGEFQVIHTRSRGDPHPLPSVFVRFLPIPDGREPFGYKSVIVTKVSARARDGYSLASQKFG